MKPQHKSIKSVALLLSLLVLMQSCSVYTKVDSSSRAMVNNNAVKIVDANNKSYYFVSLFQDNDKLYGVAKQNSKTSKLLKDHIVQEAKYSKDYVSIGLDNIEISQIYTENKGLSALGFILGISAVGALGLAIALSQGGWL